MAERPALPLETQAEIEHARDLVYSTRLLLYDLLFGVGSLGFAAKALAPPGQGPLRKPATLKLELQRYASALFDAEACFYMKHARTESELRSWLNTLSTSIEAEVMKEAAQNFHCTVSERKEAIVEGLDRRIEHWIKTAQTDSDATMVRLQNTIERGKEVLEHSREENRQSQQVAPPILPEPKPTRPRLSAMITSPGSAKRMEEYITSRGMGMTEFATKAGTTDRTLRAFRKTGKVRRDIFASIASAMNTTKEELLKP